MAPKKRTALDAQSDPFDLTPEEMGLIDPDAECRTIEPRNLEQLADGMREAFDFNRRAA